MDKKKILDFMQGMGKAARDAARILANTSTNSKNQALIEGAVSIRHHKNKSGIGANR